jgi:hypothetical protein
VRALTRLARIPALAALLLALASPALAQYGRPITEREKAGFWRAGPFRLTPLVQLRNAGVDSNPFLTPGAEESETEVVLRVGIKAYVPVGRRLRLRGDGWLDYTFFSTALETRAIDPGGDLRAELDVSRLTFFGGAGHFSARQRYTTDIDTRIQRTEDWVNGGFQLRVTKIIGLDFGVEDRSFRYDPEDTGGESIKILLDRDTLSFLGRFRYAVTPLTTAIVSAETIEDTFVFAEPSRATTKSYRYLAGFEFAPKAVITGRFLIGLRDIPPETAGSVAPKRGPAVQALILAPFLQRFQLNAAYDRDIYYSATAVVLEDQPTRNTFTYDRLRFTLDIDLPLFLVGRLIAGWQSADYTLPFTVAGVPTPREDKIREFGASLLRRIGRHARLGLTAIHTTRESTIPGADYSRWRLGVQGEFVP